jgi:ABC-type spermidine/putrescine transport system permease subunit II
LKGALTTTWDRRFDRRELLRGGAGLAVAAGLAGCGGPAQSPARADAGRARRKPPQAFDRPRFLTFFMGVFFLFLFVPIALVVLFSFNSSRSLQDFQGFSTRWYQTFFETESLRDSLVASLQIALVTMVIATILGTMLAYGLVRARTRVSSSLNVLMLLPLVTPEIVAGASALLLFTQVKLDLSLTTIILAHITFSISYVTVVVRARLVALSREVEEASMDLGATRWQTFRLVTLPPCGPRSSPPACSCSRSPSTTSCCRSSPPARAHSPCRCASGRKYGSASGRRSTQSGPSCSSSPS